MVVVSGQARRQHSGRLYHRQTAVLLAGVRQACQPPLLLKLLPAMRLPPSRSAEARQWQEGVEQQADAISELRVEAEAERRRQRGLEQPLAAAQGECAAAQADVAALLGQLRAAEGAANAAEGELQAACGWSCTAGAV